MDVENSQSISLSHPHPPPTPLQPGEHFASFHIRGSFLSRAFFGQTGVWLYPSPPRRAARDMLVRRSGSRSSAPDHPNHLPCASTRLPDREETLRVPPRRSL